MTHEERFSAALQLASAFIANGDLRLCSDTTSKGPAMSMLGDLIVSVYEVIGNAERAVTDSEEWPEQLS